VVGPTNASPPPSRQLTGQGSDREQLSGGMWIGTSPSPCWPSIGQLRGVALPGRTQRPMARQLDPGLPFPSKEPLATGPAGKLKPLSQEPGWSLLVAKAFPVRWALNQAC